MTLDNQHELICNGKVIGFVTIEDSDNLTHLGVFRPTPEFTPYKHLFDEVLLHLERMSELLDADADDTSYEAASDDWHDALEQTNELELILRWSNGGTIPIRDFQVDETNHVEFKFDNLSAHSGDGRQLIRSFAGRLSGLLRAIFTRAD